MSSSKKPFGHNRWIMVNGRCLRMVAPFVANMETRFQLNGVRIEPAAAGGALLIATDGHRMAVVHDESAAARAAFTCPVSRTLLDACKRSGPYAMVAFDGLDARVIATDDVPFVRGPKSAQKRQIACEELPPLDAPFPEWRKVFPAEMTARHRPVIVNARYAAAFGKVAEAAFPGKEERHYGFQWWQSGGQNDVLVVRNPMIPEFVGLQMPMRYETVEPLPSWLALPKAA